MASDPAMTVVNLCQARPALQPDQFFSELAATCKANGILQQDVYGDFGSSAQSSFLRKFEADMAAFLHCEDALFLPSGVMATNIAISIAKARTGNNRLLCHFSAHLQLHEQNAWKELLGMEAMVIPCDPDALSQEPMTFSSFEKTLQSHDTPPAIVVLECPHREIGGKATPLHDIQQISAYCRKHGIHLFMDGARLWEAQAVYPLDQLCPLFDSIYVSTYKGLGGLTGAFLVSTEAFVDQARVWLRRFGGNVFSLLPYYVSAWQGFQAHRTDFSNRRDELAHILAQITAALQEDAKEGKVWIRFDPPVPAICLVHVYLDTDDLDGAQAAVSKVAQDSGIVVATRLRRGQWGAARRQVYTEFNLGASNRSIPVDVWMRGYVLLQQELRKVLGDK